MAYGGDPIIDYAEAELAMMAKPKPTANSHLRTGRVQDLRKGSRTTPVPSGKTYRRRPKHKGQEEK